MSYDRNDDLAYGEYHGQGNEGEGERGIVGDIGKRFFGGRKTQGEQSNPQSSSGGMSFVFDKLHKELHGIGTEIKNKLSGQEEVHSHTHEAGECSTGTHDHHAEHRFLSFAPERHGNDIKWYVDACGYMWAVSIALERARESIWILDWWLSPELYLRRPPAKFEQYRIDRMLQSAAERGVKVNIIVYKEVTQALSRSNPQSFSSTQYNQEQDYFNPTLPDYLHSLLPRSTDRFTKLLTRAGLHVVFKSLEEVEKTDPLIKPPITVSSSHTKHALENLHPNIAVFRHPDHLPDQQVVASDLLNSLKNMSAAKFSQLPGDSLKAIYGMHEDTVLYWAHHEKLCLVDGHTAFMGGLDLCYGRWDTNQHSIADVHPGDLDKIVFPGQDYNNARIMDFQDVVHWQNNKLDRTKNSRMGWSDLSLCITGPVTQDLHEHFAERWNFIYDEKYNSRKDARYVRLAAPEQSTGASSSYGQEYPPPPQQPNRGFDGNERERGFGDDEEGERGLFGGDGQGGFRERLHERAGRYREELGQRYGVGGHQGGGQHHGGAPRGGVSCQITRSCAKWSHGVPIEHSIANAYIEVIRDSQHFVYIENQFFISATSDSQKPIKNKIASAIVERILRAARNGEKYKMMVMMPAIPAFAGDLKADDALSTRAIMEFQYNSINRGGHSIYEEIARAGFNPMEYIRFYNLRSYDRINASGALRAAEQQSGVSYEDARMQHDAAFGGVYRSEGKEDYQPYRPPPPEQLGQPGGVYEMDAGYGQASGDRGTPYQAYNPYQKEGYGQPGSQGQRPDAYHQYQQGASQIGDRDGLGSGRWDTVAECYMLGGEDIRNVPWEGGAMDEIDAFVSEELYIHSKLLIADDRIVICGSANLNDRSQLGDHDSEIAVIVNDPTPVESYMDGRPYQASKFAASLRRQLFRKHLGLVKPQAMDRPDQNYEPIGVPNIYDWDSREDRQVADPVSDDFQSLWNYRAKTNTDAFARLFHPVPYDGVRTWKQYDEYYERFFKEEQKEKEKEKKPSQYKWGHVVAEDFPGGVQEVKEVLSTIKGTLVEMPLMFLKDEDIAKEGLGLNAFTEEVYT